MMTEVAEKFVFFGGPKDWELLTANRDIHFGEKAVVVIYKEMDTFEQRLEMLKSVPSR